MKRTLKWLVLVLALGALAFGVVRTVKQRQAAQQAASQSAERIESVMELTAADMVPVHMQALTQVLPVSGSLKATQTAFIKARVAGELQDLSLREGDLVKAGQVVARVDPTDAQARLRQTQQQAQAAKAQVDIAQRTYDNNSKLVEQGFISKWALDSSSASLASAQANHRAAMAGVEVIDKQLLDTVLRAPISGVIAQRLAQNGERIGIDGRVLELVDISRLELEASLAASDSPLIRLGQVAELQIEGTPEPVRAKVVRINPTVMAGSRSVLVYLTLDAAPGLRQGLFAQGSLTIASTDALAIPISAVRTDKPRPYVQLVRDNKVVHLPVELGARGLVKGEWMVAVTGLAPDSALIAGSVGQLREATTVKLPSGAL